MAADPPAACGLRWRLMAELPGSVRLALWVTAAWNDKVSLRAALARAFPDLDHVVLTVPDPDATAARLAELGMARDGDRLVVNDRFVVLRRGDAAEGDRPLLNHLAFLVDSADRVQQEARTRGLEVEDVVDAPNTLAVFLRGPDRIRIEYVEHKPGFSLV